MPKDICSHMHLWQKRKKKERKRKTRINSDVKLRDKLSKLWYIPRGDKYSITRDVYNKF